MKKLFSFFLICIFLTPGIYAFDKIAAKHVEDRTFEISLGISANLSNNFFSIRDILSEILVIDLDKFAFGVKADLGVEMPMHLNLNLKKWGIGLFSGINASGALGLHENMLSLKSATDDKSDLNAAVFFYAGINSFFHIQRFKVKIKPAVYYPLLYVVPVSPQRIYYTFDSYNDTNRIDLGYYMRVYSAFQIDAMTGMSDFNLTALPGFDICAGVEYPLSEVTGLEEKYPFLDFDIGLDFINIPIISSKMKNYIQSSGNIYIKRDESENLDDLINSFTGSVNYSTINGVDSDYSVFRTFKLLVWSNWRPLSGSSLFTITPVVGFAHNALFYKTISVEAGLNLQLNVNNIFIVNAGINYNDRVWKNSINLAFNCRLLQIDIGADVRSPDFIGSWTAKGFNAKVGLKLGW